MLDPFHMRYPHFTSHKHYSVIIMPLGEKCTLNFQPLSLMEGQGLEPFRLQRLDFGVKFGAVQTDRLAVIDHLTDLNVAGRAEQAVGVREVQGELLL